MSTQEVYDLVVIGGGPGGYTAAFHAAKRGMRAALVEVFKLGGVCLHAGCIPYKALLENIRVLDMTRRGAEFGIDLAIGGFDFTKMMSRKDRIVERLHGGLQTLVKRNGVDYFDGMGRPAGRGKVVVRSFKEQKEYELTAKNVIIATGSKPKFIPAFAADGQRILYSDHIVELKKVPQELVILGGGAIGVETATVFASLGTKVTILEAAPRIMGLEDEEISQTLERRLVEKGIVIVTGAKVGGVAKSEGGVTVAYDDAGGTSNEVQGDVFLVAIGRDGMTEGLGLEEAGVTLDRGYIKVDELMRTTAPDIYAIGDVAGPPLLAHKAAAEGELAVDTMAGRSGTKVDANKIPHCTYCEPQVASIGMTEAEAREQVGDIKVGRFSFRINGKALCEGEELGFIKIIAAAGTDEIIGAHMIGAEVTELVMEVSEAMFAESTLGQLAEAIHAHPTRSEAIKEAARDVYGMAITK